MKNIKWKWNQFKSNSSHESYIKIMIKSSHLHRRSWISRRLQMKLVQWTSVSLFYPKSHNNICPIDLLLIGASCDYYSDLHAADLPLLQTAVSASPPSNVLTDARYEWVIREDLAVSDLSKIMPLIRILTVSQPWGSKSRVTWMTLTFLLLENMGHNISSALTLSISFLKW